MSMEITRNYSNYTMYNGAKSKAARTAEVPTTEENGRTEKNEAYLKDLNAKFPSLDLEMSNFLSAQNDHRISFGINPAVLENMQNDPKKEKEVSELLGGAVQARDLVAALHKASGHEYVYSHDYIDENGQYWHTSMSVKKDYINEELRKKAQEETEKRIKDSVEKTREKREEIAEKIAEHSTENTEEMNDTIGNIAIDFKV